jgi:hypothetical protein
MHIGDEKPAQVGYHAFFHQLMLNNQGTQIPWFYALVDTQPKVDTRPTRVETLNLL